MLVRAPVPRTELPRSSAVAVRRSFFGPVPKPIVSEGAKAGLIAGGIVVAALLITGGIILVR